MSSVRAEDKVGNLFQQPANKKPSSLSARDEGLRAPWYHPDSATIPRGICPPFIIIRHVDESELITLRSFTSPAQRRVRRATGWFAPSTSSLCSVTPRTTPHRRRYSFVPKTGVSVLVPCLPPDFNIIVTTRVNGPDTAYPAKITNIITCGHATISISARIPQTR